MSDSTEPTGGPKGARLDRLSPALRSTIEELRTTRDRLRVQAHLAKLDLQEQWEQLQPRVDKLERELETRGQQVGEALEQTANQLRDELVSLWSRGRGDT